MAVLPLLALAGAAQAQFNCKTNGQKLTITSYSGSSDSLTIPNTLYGLTVVGIGNAAFQNCTTLTSVTIPMSVTAIGDNAFGGCTNLTEIDVDSLNQIYSSEDGVLLDYNQTTLIQFPGGRRGSYSIPDNVTNIGDYAFYQCVNLSGIEIANKVKALGDYVFYGCVALTNVSIPDTLTTIGDGAFYGCASLAEIAISNNVSSIGEGAFCNCANLARFTVPSKVTRIMADMFSGCVSLGSVTIPSSVRTIEKHAFKDCVGLTNITLPNSVTTFGYGAFADCAGLANISLPNQMTGIADNVFSGCANLRSVTIPVSVTSLGDYVFSDCTNLTSIIIPRKVARIGSYCFSGCGSLVSFTATNSLISIGESAFLDCVSLPAIAIPTNVTSIQSSTFSGCGALASVRMSTRVKSIGNYAFSGCSSLRGITIRAGIKTIGNNAFAGCSSLTNISLPSNVKTLGDEAFAGCSSLVGAKLTSIKSIGNSAFADCVSLTNVTIPSTVTNIGSYAFSGCASLTRAVIGAKVRSIGDHAFADCAGLESATMGYTVRSLGDYAFAGCAGLTNVTLGTNLASTGSYTFMGCTSLSAITIPYNVTYIGDYAFAGCTSLTTVNLPNTVTSIGAGAFQDCVNLAAISIPRKVVNVKYRAFYGCPALTEVFFLGNAPSSIESEVFLGAPNVNVYYAYGTTGWTSTIDDCPTVLVTAPVIVREPAAQYVSIGDKAVFTVKAFAPGSAKYQWRFNGANISGARTGTNAISPVQGRNAGGYTVVVGNSYGSVTSSAALLTLKPKVTISVPKTGLTVKTSTLAVRGVATGDFKTGGSISYRAGAKAAWTVAQGTTNWTGSVTLSGGVNWVQAFATDANGNISATVSNKVTYTSSASVAVASVSAVSGTGAQSEPSLSAVAGDYKGLITAGNPFDNTFSGAFAMTVTPGGAFSAKLVFPAQTVSGGGSVALDEERTNAVARFTTQIGGQTVQTSLLLALDSSGAATGALTAGGEPRALAQIDGAMVANTTNAGCCNVSVFSAATNAPADYGYGTVAVSETGVTIRLVLNDEKAAVVVLATDRLKNGAIPVFAPLYSKQGFLSGWLTLDEQRVLSESALAWHKEAAAGASSSPEGFSRWVFLQGDLCGASTNSN